MDHTTELADLDGNYGGMTSTAPRNAYSNQEVGERPWGRWSVLDSGPGYTVKKMEVDPGHRLSLQYHHHRSEHWLVISGVGEVEIDGETSAIVERSHVHIPLKAVHRVRNNGTVPLVILELQQGDVLDEADIVRLEDDYAR
jgi:mannose-6-phosphate isomerase